jgi:hypothetical protein
MIKERNEAHIQKCGIVYLEHFILAPLAALRSEIAVYKFQRHEWLYRCAVRLDDFAICKHDIGDNLAVILYDKIKLRNKLIR